MAIALWFAVAALQLAAAPAQTSFAAEAAVVLIAAHSGFHPPHTLPDPTQFHVCRVFKRYGGGVCTSPPYAPIGKRSSSRMLASITR
jgi:hypothetical protein